MEIALGGALAALLGGASNIIVLGTTRLQGNIRRSRRRSHIPDTITGMATDTPAADALASLRHVLLQLGEVECGIEEAIDELGQVEDAAELVTEVLWIGCDLEQLAARLVAVKRRVVVLEAIEQRETTTDEVQGAWEPRPRCHDGRCG